MVIDSTKKDIQYLEKRIRQLKKDFSSGKISKQRYTWRLTEYQGSLERKKSKIKRRNRAKERVKKHEKTRRNIKKGLQSFGKGGGYKLKGIPAGRKIY